MMKKLNKQRLKRKLRVRSKISGKKNHARLTVFRSNKFIYAQIIDDSAGKTIIAVSEKELKIDKNQKMTKSQRANALGRMIAHKASQKKIKRIVFDRGSYKYHGRIKALAEGAKEEGLIL